MEIYGRTRSATPAIAALFTDANSCYRLAFQRHGVTTPHTRTKAETRLIESANSSIRDNLARFNPRSKRYSKSWERLNITPDLFFHRHLITNSR